MPDYGRRESDIGFREIADFSALSGDWVTKSNSQTTPQTLSGRPAPRPEATRGLSVTGGTLEGGSYQLPEVSDFPVMKNTEAVNDTGSLLSPLRS